MGKRQPRMIFQTQGGHYAAFTFDPTITGGEIDRVIETHEASSEQPGTWLTTVLRDNGAIVTYHSRKPGW